MSDDLTRARRTASSREEAHTSLSSVSRPALTAGSAGGSSDSLHDAIRRAASSPTGILFNATDDEPPTPAATEHRLRKSCDYCVRMKRACDGKTPCGLCTRRNKECTRSVKKKSGPAKGTKYAARRTRSHDELRRSGYNDGSEAGSSSSSRSALVGMRRTASSGDSCVPFPLGTMKSSQIHGTPYRFVPHASPRVAHRTSFPPGRLRFLPPGKVGVGVRREVNRDGVAGAAASAGVVGGGGIQDAGDDPGVGARFARRPGEEFSNRYHQLGGGGSSGGDGGGVGGTSGNDTESQQLIRNFPGVLQDPSIWTSPSSEELRIARDLEPDAFGRSITAASTGPSHPVYARPAVTRGSHSYNKAIDSQVATRAGNVSIMRRDLEDRGDRSRVTGGDTVAAIAGPGWARGGVQQERSGNSGGIGKGGNDSGAVASLPLEWASRLSLQQNNQRDGGNSDQPHYFPQAMRRSQYQQQRGQHPSAHHNIFSSDGSIAMPSSNIAGQDTHPNIQPLGSSVRRSAYRGSGPAKSVAFEAESGLGFSAADKGVSEGMKIGHGYDFSPPGLGSSDRGRDQLSSGDLQPQQRQIQQRWQQQHLQQQRQQQQQQQQQQQLQHQRQLQQQNEVWRLQQMAAQGQIHPSMSAVSHPSTILHDASHQPKDSSSGSTSRFFPPLASQETPHRTPSLDSAIPNVGELARDVAATADRAISQASSPRYELGWARSVGGAPRYIQAHLTPAGVSQEEEIEGRYVREFGAGRQPGAQDNQR